SHERHCDRISPIRPLRPEELQAVADGGVRRRDASSQQGGQRQRSRAGSEGDVSLRRPRAVALLLLPEVADTPFDGLADLLGKVRRRRRGGGGCSAGQQHPEEEGGEGSHAWTSGGVLNQRPANSLPPSPPGTRRESARRIVRARGRS